MRKGENDMMSGMNMHVYSKNKLKNEAIKIEPSVK